MATTSKPQKILIKTALVSFEDLYLVDSFGIKKGSDYVIRKDQDDKTLYQVWADDLETLVCHLYKKEVEELFFLGELKPIEPIPAEWAEE